MKRKCFVFCLSILFSLAMISVAFASDTGLEKKKECSDSNPLSNSLSIRKASNSNNDMTKKVGFSATDGNGTIFINSPNKNTTYFKGEKIHFDFTAYDNWVYVWAGPTVRLINVSTDKRYYEEDFEVVDNDSYSDYDGDIITKPVPVGNYEFSVILYPYDYKYDADPVSDYLDWNLPKAELYLTIKQLKAPTRVKAKAGKKKVIVSFKAAVGASKYEVYRSLKKKSGYKKIKTTTSKRFIDKKVKKNKKYYYKIKTVRNEKNLIKSGFSSVSCSGKVK